MGPCFYFFIVKIPGRKRPLSAVGDADHCNSMAFMVQYCAFMPRTSTRMSRLAG